MGMCVHVCVRVCGCMCVRMCVGMYTYVYCMCTYVFFCFLCLTFVHVCVKSIGNLGANDFQVVQRQNYDPSKVRVSVRGSGS